MTPDETEWWEEKLASYLAEGDDALAAGKSPSTAHMSSENEPQLQRDLDYLKKLRRVLRRPGAEAPRDSPAFLKLPNPLGRFRIRHELGRGGFGVVFLAYDPLLARDVALKVPRSEVLPRPICALGFIARRGQPPGLIIQTWCQFTRPAKSTRFATLSRPTALGRLWLSGSKRARSRSPGGKRPSCWRHSPKRPTTRTSAASSTEISSRGTYCFSRMKNGE